MRRDVALALKKQRLQFQSDALRGELRDNLDAVLSPVAAVADNAMAGVDWLKSHPAFLVGGLAAVVVARPRRVWRWGWRLWGALRAARRLGPYLAMWAVRARQSE